MPEPLSEQRLAEIEGRLKAATPGEWQADVSDNWRCMRDYPDVDSMPADKIGYDVLGPAMLDCDDDWSYYHKADAEMLAAAPTDLTDLLGEVRRLRRIETAARSFLDHMALPLDDDARAVLRQLCNSLEAPDDPQR